MSFVDAPDFDTEAGRKDGAFPRFYMDTISDKASSDREGRPMFRDVEMVEVMVPGDRLNTPVFQVTEVHRKRWPREYAAFKANQEAPVQGTPLDQLPGITGARVKELQYFHVRTIEQLGDMPDDLLMKAAPMDGHAIRERARRWLSATAGNAAEERLAAENHALKANMASMERDMSDLRAMVEKLTAAQTAQQAAPMPGVG